MHYQVQNISRFTFKQQNNVGCSSFMILIYFDTMKEREAKLYHRRSVK